MWFPADSTCPFGGAETGHGASRPKNTQGWAQNKLGLGSIPLLQNPNLEAKSKTHPYVKQTRNDGHMVQTCCTRQPRCCPDLRGSVIVIGLSDWTFIPGLNAMPGLLQRFLPRDDDYFCSSRGKRRIFRRARRLFATCFRVTRRFTSRYRASIEHAGDEIAHTIIMKLGQTFITP